MECIFLEKEHQRQGRNKDTLINQAYIESGEYRKKFDFITDNKEINRLLYNCAKQMLYHRSGTLYEDMYWIDPIAKKVVAQETHQTAEKKILYSKKTKKNIKSYKNLITIHSHPSSFPPSIDDYNSNYKNNYSLGIICGHDGKVFIYTADIEINKSYFRKKVEYFRKLAIMIMKHS